MGKIRDKKQIIKPKLLVKQKSALPIPQSLDKFTYIWYVRPSVILVLHKTFLKTSLYKKFHICYFSKIP